MTTALIKQYTRNHIEKLREEIIRLEKEANYLEKNINVDCLEYKRERDAVNNGFKNYHAQYVAEVMEEAIRNKWNKKIDSLGNQQFSDKYIEMQESKAKEVKRIIALVKAKDISKRDSNKKLIESIKSIEKEGEEKQ